LDPFSARPPTPSCVPLSLADSAAGYVVIVGRPLLPPAVVLGSATTAGSGASIHHQASSRCPDPPSWTSWPATGHATRPLEPHRLAAGGVGIHLRVATASAPARRPRCPATPHPSRQADSLHESPRSCEPPTSRDSSSRLPRRRRDPTVAIHVRSAR
jgi:hypothetical protein